MLSVILLCSDALKDAGAEAVVRTLAPLVQGLVRGLVRDVVLAGRPGQDLALIADHAGCAVVEAATEAVALRQAIGEARADDLLIFRAGHVPEAGFFEAVEDQLTIGLAKGGVRVRVAPQSFLERLLPVAAPAVGLIARRALCGAAAARSLPHLIKIIAPRRTLRARLHRLI